MHVSLPLSRQDWKVPAREHVLSLSWLPLALWTVCLGGAALYAYVFVRIAVRRVPYPFEIEAGEGGMLDQLHQILAGHPLYAAPTLQYASNIYPPLYSYVSVLFALALGDTFTPMRFISVLSTVGSAALIYATVARETGHRRSALLGAGFYLASFQVTGAWMDNARVDSFALFLLLATVYVVRFYPHNGGTLVAAGLGLLDLETKQTGALLLAVLALYLLLARGWRSFALFSVPLAALYGVAHLTLNAIYQGWYSYYVFFLPSRHTLQDAAVNNFWPFDVMARFGIATLLGTILLALLIARRRHNTALFYALVTGSLVLSAWFGRANRGGYVNALMPLAAILAILLGLAVAEIIHALRGMDRRPRLIFESYVLLLAVAQLAFLTYEPTQQFPGPADMAAGSGLVQTIASVQGDVFMPDHSYLAEMAGKPPTISTGLLSELWGTEGGGQSAEGARLQAELEQALAQRHYQAIILDDDHWPDWFMADLSRYYVKTDVPLFPNPWVFWPLTAAQVRPTDLYVPAPG